MKIFDSLKHKKWSGRGFELKPNSILILKSANLEHAVNLRKGKYKIKMLVKKRTGNGNFKIVISTDKNNILFSEETSATSVAMSEKTFEFSLNKNFGIGSIKILRDGKFYGSLEIGRLILDVDSEINIEEIKENMSSANSTKKLSHNPTIIELGSFRNICFIVPYHIYGGAEVYIRNIIDLLDPRIKVSLVYLNENPLQNSFKRVDLEHKVIKNPSHIRGYLNSNNFDKIIYYNRLDVYNLLTSLKSDPNFNSDLIEIYHSDFKWPGSISSKEDRIGISKIITVSESLAKNIKGNHELEVIPVGIDLDKFQPRAGGNLRDAFGISSQKMIIGTVARLSKEKNLDYIIDLATISEDYHFVIVGDGPDRSRLQDMISRRNIDNVSLVGHRKNVEHFYNMFDAFVLASKMEGTPISIIEAMASGVPVFSNMVGAIPDIIKNGETGFSITGDPSEDISIIKNNMHNLSVIENARNYIIQNHNIITNSKKFMESLILSEFFYEPVNSDVVLSLNGEYI